MRAVNTKDSVLTLNNRIGDLVAGAFFCCGGLAGFLGFASMVQLWKPSTLGEAVKGTMGLLIPFCFALTLLLFGLRNICGREGVRIDANKKEVCVWHRSIWLRRKESLFRFEQLKHIKIKEQRMHGVFSPDRIFRVVAGDEPDEAELHYFLDVSEAKALAKQVAEFTGLQF
jgi:hypothetical protein